LRKYKLEYRSKKSSTTDDLNKNANTNTNNVKVIVNTNSNTNANAEDNGNNKDNKIYITEPKPIKIRTFKDNIHAFEVNYSYEKSLTKLTFDLIEEASILLDDPIINVIPHIHKGSKMFAVQTKNKSFK